MKDIKQLLEQSAAADPAACGGCLIIGEVAQAHDGSLGTAHAYIDAIANAGADAVKFQTHLAAAESTPAEPWRVKFSPQDESRYAYWKRMEFTGEQWLGLKHHAGEKGILFLSSPFSLEAVELLIRVGVPAWKLASGELAGAKMFDAMAATGLPFLVSSGMSSMSEIDAIVHRLRKRSLPLALMQCTTAYPCPAEKIGLNLLPFFRSRYHCAVGLSDHSGTIYPGLAAAAIGCSALEVHVTLSRESFGPDVPASLTTFELKQLVEGVRFIERMKIHPVDKDTVAQEMMPLRKLFTKSLVAKVDLPAGTVLREEHLALKKPGTGIPEARIGEVLNRKLKKPMPANTLLQEQDLE
ncbi:MAG TPA: N-acetylneuraminate synthase family protein [Verrucomicrobiae bacterium]